MVLSINWHASQKIPNAIATLSTTWSTSNETVRSYYDSWIISKEGSSNAGDMLYAACIMLDTEILAQLMPVPRDLSCNTTVPFRSPYWLNMVEAKPNTNTNTKKAFRVALFGEFDLLHYWFD
ncbi:hypothetical protein IWW34DRAFT_809593 [Fusarium oxysporum f. sp. albedinis]|nr:hypothetical protein IWW34DRAFT_809593 [Fusarium oxysporum f. sp. albedinis]